MNTNLLRDSTGVRLLNRPEGRIAYEVLDPRAAATNALVVAAPGMGDLRSSYRYLAPALSAEGYRVAVTDLRGHGDSDATFRDYGDQQTADDMGALVRALHKPEERVILIGNSMAAGAAVVLAADNPGLVDGLVLIGPFVRDQPTTWANRLLLRVAMAPWWASVSWRSYLPSLFAGRRPDDFEQERKRVVAAIGRPGFRSAFSRTTRATHGQAEKSLGRVNVPTLVVMGALDPDFKDPAAEASWVAGALRGSASVVPDSGHYPHVQQPEAVARVVIPFLEAISTPRSLDA